MSLVEDKMLLSILSVLSLLRYLSAESLPDGTIACDPAQRPYVMTSPGLITTLGFNSGTDYGNDVICEWLIQTGDGEEVFIEFGINSLIEDCIGCECDGLEVYGQNSTGDILLLNTFCGELDGFSGVSTENTFIRFRSDSSITFRGFQAQITFVDAACELAEGAPIIESSGWIASPGYPNGYLNDEICRWNLRTAPGQLVQWQFEDLNVEEGCDFIGSIYDFVQFEEIDAAAEDRLLGRFYGNDFVPGWTYQSQGPIGTSVLFYSDFTVTGVGFNLTYQFVNDDQYAGDKI